MPFFRDNPAEIRRALMEACACVACVLFTELFHLHYGYLGIITVHMLMAAETPSIVQKAFERIVGRCAGVLTGVVIISLFRDRILLCLLVLIAFKLVFFYIFESGRFSYSGMQAGIFSVSIVGIGLTQPYEVSIAASAMIEQILLGIGVAIVFSWLGGMQTRASIDPTLPALLPLRLDWLNKSARITAGMLATLLVALYFQLPMIPAAVSAGIIGIAPDQRARLMKGGERSLGALIGSCYTLPALFVIIQAPHFLVLLVFLFVGMFLSAYLTRTATAHSYVWLQFGLVVGMVLVGSDNGIGNFSTALERLLGIWTAMIVTLSVEALWPGEVDPVPVAPASAQRSA